MSQRQCPPRAGPLQRNTPWNPARATEAFLCSEKLNTLHRRHRVQFTWVYKFIVNIRDPQRMNPSNQHQVKNLHMYTRYIRRTVTSHSDSTRRINTVVNIHGPQRINPNDFGYSHGCHQIFSSVHEITKKNPSPPSAQNGFTCTQGIWKWFSKDIWLSRGWTQLWLLAPPSGRHCWSISLLFIGCEIPQQLLSTSLWDLVRIFMIPRGQIPIIIVIPETVCHHQTKTVSCVHEIIKKWIAQFSSDSQEEEHLWFVSSTKTQNFLISV